MRTQVARRRFTTDEFHQMATAGILSEDDRVELIEGELLEMSPNDPPHAGTIGMLNGRLVAAYGGRGHVRVQLPIVASEISLPEPDFAVARGDHRTYIDRKSTRLNSSHRL